MPILEKDKALLASQSASKTVMEWLDYFNGLYTKNQIYCWCHRNGYSFRQRTKEQISQQQSNNARKYNINKNYFKVWTNNMAYTLGLWWADGCIYKGQMFDITLHKKDKYILKRIAQDMGYEGSVVDFHNSQASRLNFSCVEMYRDIQHLGGTQRKSLTAIFPNCIPEEYMADFIRGIFDGDGSIWNVKGGRINTQFCSGCKQFLLDLWQTLKKYTAIQGGSIHLANSSCYELVFGKRDSIKIGNFMYQNNPEIYLLRKYEKFKPFLS